MRHSPFEAPKEAYSIMNVLITFVRNKEAKKEQYQ